MPLGGVIDGQLGGAQMSAGPPLAATTGNGMQARIVTPFPMGLHGNCITLSSEDREMMKPTIPTGDKGKPVHPISDSILAPVVEN